MLHHVAGREKKQVEFQISFFGKLILKIYQIYLWNFKYHFFRKPQFEDLPNLPVRMPFFDVGGVHTTTREVAWISLNSKLPTWDGTEI